MAPASGVKQSNGIHGGGRLGESSTSTPASTSNGSTSHSTSDSGSSSSSETIPTLVTIDPSIPAHEQKNIHTRWHPDIPAVCSIVEGEAFRVECMDYSGECERASDSEWPRASQNVCKLSSLVVFVLLID